LLDSHVLIWAAEGKLSGLGREVIEEQAEVVVVSAATIWEIEIKRALGRLASPPGLIEMIEEAGFEQLPISSEHSLQAARLPLHHRDPFDRMLVAQARVEGLTLATADRVMADYDVPLMAVSRAAD
jgi:PIN domain nuclease of toxin-antitoxin system